jgi:multidrug resistance efflux pump
MNYQKIYSAGRNILFLMRFIPLRVVFTAFLMLIFSIYILFAKIDIVSTGTGVITGSNDKIDIVSPDSGFISVFDLKSGDKVNRGDPLFTYVNLDSFYKEKNLKELVLYLKKNVSEISGDLNLLMMLVNSVDGKIAHDEYLNSNQELSAYKFYHEKMELNTDDNNYFSRIQQIKENIDNLLMQKLILQKKSLLLKKSAAPEIELLNNESEISKIESQQINDKISILDLENSHKKQADDFYNRLLSEVSRESRDLTEQKKEIIKNEGELELLQNKVKSNSLLSPVDGVVLDITQSLTEGSYLEPSQLVLKIKKNIVEHLIDARFDTKYRPFIFNGAKVKIVVNSPGYKKYYNGSISKISADSFVDKEKSIEDNHRYYKVEILYDKNNGEIPEYSEGIQVSVYAISKKISIFDYLFSLINSNVIFNVW